MPDLLKLTADTVLFCDRGLADRFEAAETRPLTPKTRVPESTACGCCANTGTPPQGNR